MKPNLTYEYISGGSPVLMREKANGVLIAYYTAYIDHGINFWILYPQKRLVYRKDVAFTKKKISVREAAVLPNPDLIYPPIAPETRKEVKKETDDPYFKPIKGEQIKMI